MSESDNRLVDEVDRHMQIREQFSDVALRHGRNLNTVAALVGVTSEVVNSDEFMEKYGINEEQIQLFEGWLQKLYEQHPYIVMDLFAAFLRFYATITLTLEA